MKHSFVQWHPSIITSSDCEGAGEVFTVISEASFTPDQRFPNWKRQRKSFFFCSPKKYLTVYSQFHLEALAQSMNKVWTLAPTFRAERSDTARYLSEFYMLEAELAFVEALRDVMNVVEGILRVIATEQSSTVGQELLGVRLQGEEQEGASVSRSTFTRR
jgi:asparaginyl-tRNA synthetase